MKKLSNLYTIFTSNTFLISSAKIRLFPHTAMDFCHLFPKYMFFLIYVKQLYTFEA